MNKKLKGVFVGLLCFWGLSIYPLIGGAQLPTQGEIVIERESGSEPSGSTAPPPDRVDTGGTPVKKTGLLPSTGELTKPVLLLLGGVFVLVVVIGLRYSLKHEKDKEERTDEDE